jgi:uncharacterized protein YjaZ
MFKAVKMTKEIWKEYTNSLITHFQKVLNEAELRVKAQEEALIKQKKEEKASGEKQIKYIKNYYYELMRDFDIESHFLNPEEVTDPELIEQAFMKDIKESHVNKEISGIRKLSFQLSNRKKVGLQDFMLRCLENMYSIPEFFKWVNSETNHEKKWENIERLLGREIEALAYDSD